MAFSGEIWSWRGPSPYHFITVPDEISVRLRAMSSLVSYGWGMIPVRYRIGHTDSGTSLFPKDGRYLLPIKDAVRKAERLAAGDTVTVRLSIRSDERR
jgi:hypothetical protein